MDMLPATRAPRAVVVPEVVLPPVRRAFAFTRASAPPDGDYETPEPVGMRGLLIDVYV